MVDKSKIVSKVSAYRYLEDHYIEVDRFIYDNFNFEDRLYIRNLFLYDPITAYQMLNNHLLPNHIKYEMMVEEISKPGNITIVIGGKGSGKTAFVSKLVDDLSK